MELSTDQASPQQTTGFSEKGLSFSFHVPKDSDSLGKQSLPVRRIVSRHRAYAS